MCTTIPAGHVLYRRLTKKSVLGFGKYANLTVGDVLTKLRYFEGQEYLAWCYYHCSNITFVDEILDELKITERIEKPSTTLSDKEEQRLFNSWKHSYRREVGKSEEFILGLYSHDRRGRKDYFQKRINSSEKMEEKSKGWLAWKNQGHF